MSMKISPCSMVKLARRYLAHRRSFGYRLRGADYDLLAFARFLDRTAPGQPLSTKLALQWLKAKPCQPATIAVRLSTIRGFARFCATLDPRTQIPSTHLFPRRDSRRAPHIFTDAQLQLLLRRTQGLRPWRNELRPLVYRTLIALLACSGIRPSEAIRLRAGDFNATTGTLRVPAVKRSPERTLPLHPSTVRALQRYQSIRRSHYPFASHFFVGTFRPALADVRCRLDLSPVWCAGSPAMVHVQVRVFTICATGLPQSGLRAGVANPFHWPTAWSCSLAIWDTGISTTRIGMCSPSPPRSKRRPLDSNGIIVNLPQPDRLCHPPHSQCFCNSSSRTCVPRRRSASTPSPLTGIL